MEINDYQEKCRETAIYPGQNSLFGLNYVVLGLTGESGEIANKLKKVYRDNGVRLDAYFRDQLIDELGDTLWYAAMLASELNISLEEVFTRNLAKLTRRKETGMLQGSGDR